MAEAILNDYFYGDESEEFIFFRIPRLLITSPRFKHLSTDAKLLYGMLLDRMSLSAKNGWCDDTGRVFIYYTLDDICDDLMCCTEKAVKLLAELDTKKGVGLIERIKQGQGKPTKIYVKRFTGQTAPSPDFGKSELQTSEKPKSRPRKNRSADLGKSKCSNTNQNHTDFSHNNLSIPPSPPPAVVMGLEMDRYEKRERVKENIDYEILQQQCPYDDVESLLELIVDVMCSTAATIRIGGEYLPASTVKLRLDQLNSSHITYVIDAMAKTTTKINNIRAYLLTTLYNAPTTMGPYYSAEVRHDFG